MRRALWYLLVLAVLVAVAVWFADRPGTVAMDWQGYRIETSVGLLVLAAGALAVLAALAYRFWRAVRGAPAAIGHTRHERKRHKGYKALTQGMVAVAAGDPEEARKLAKRADVLLNEPPLTMLLSAQAAQLDGDHRAAEKYFKAMLERPETAFLGLRGLLMQASRDGDSARALDYARQAYALRPDTGWLGDELLQLEAGAGNWSAAGKVLGTGRTGGGRKGAPPAASHRTHAVIAHQMSLEAEAAGQADTALAHAKTAHETAPDFAPAAARYARLLTARGKRRKAAKLIEAAWTRAPHPDLADAYGETGGAAPLERVKRYERLAGLKPEHVESQLALARAALDARLFGEARHHLLQVANRAAGDDGDGGDGEAAPDGTAPDARVYRLLAELERAEHNDEAAAAGWLARADAADRGPSWLCGDCGAEAAAWSALCGHCGAFDTLTWRHRPRVAAIGPTPDEDAETADDSVPTIDADTDTETPALVDPSATTSAAPVPAAPSAARPA